ncbi:MAG TPA: hypothetical protein VK455_05845 [Thermoplasmata archaeon]|nr:hypothetical protein [Thermoplasmata archaeon]
MPTWTFRLKGQFHRDGGFIAADYQGQSVRAGTANGRPVIEVVESNYDVPRATFELDSIFGFMVGGASVIRVWRRDPGSVGECVLTDVVSNFADPGKLGGVETWDLQLRRNDPNGPQGRMLARWVSEVARIG